MEQTTDDNNVIALQDTPVELPESVMVTRESDNTQTAAGEVEEIDSSAAETKPGQPASRTTAGKTEAPPNPLLNDPYEWDQCTITLIYAVLPDKTASVSVHNHKDEPIVRTFSAADVPMPEKISNVLGILQGIWPDSTVSATFVLMPLQAGAEERIILVSIRAGNDTPIVQTEVESALPFPDQIQAMMEELKISLPARALKQIEKEAKTRITPASKAAAKPAAKQTVDSPATVNKSQLSLF